MPGHPTPYRAAVPHDHFDERIAPAYDRTSAALFAPSALDPTVAFLAGLAGTGAALELGIGSGRVALPLSRLGVRVHGIDLSPSMVAQLAAKPGSEAIAVTIGDIATTTVEGPFRLVFVVFNTISNLTTQAEQVACFANAAYHLEPGGRFVVELWVPELQRLPPGERIRPVRVDDGGLSFDEIDVVTQSGTSHHYAFVDGRLDRFSVPYRYAWPAELDLMAQLAGLDLRERWGGWNHEPFTSASTSHVSVWEKPR